MSDDWADENALVIADGSTDLAVVPLPEFDPGDYPTQFDALNAFHRAVSQLEEEDLSRALRDGWVPTDHDVLIEAGMRCLPLLDSVDLEPGSSALARLESIAVRVRSQTPTHQNSVALQEWEGAIASAKSSANTSTALGCMMLLVMFAAVVGFFAL